MSNVLSKASHAIVKIRSLFLLLFCIAIFIDAVMEKKSDAALLFIIVSWLLAVQGYAFKSTATFKVALGFLIFLFILFPFARTNPLVERVSTWIYLFLVVGIVQQFRELSAR